MSSVITPLFHHNLAQTVYDEVQNRTAIYHYFIGKTLEWDDESTPSIPSEYVEYENDVRNNIIQTKQVQINDVSLVIPRTNWTGGQVYDMYDDTISPSNPAYSGATSLKTSNFYVITEDFNIYKCLYNNGDGVSTVEPSGTSSSYFETSDGYIWKFISFIPLGLRNKFLTSSFVPITKSIKNQYYSAGSIIGYNILDGGEDYDPDETYVVIQGNGSGPYGKSLSTSITYNITVKNGTNYAGIGNKFYIDNTVSPTINLIEDNTYIFDQSDPSNANHPLKFSITLDGTHSGGVEYTTGVTYEGTPGQPGAYTQIVVPAGASNLYYYCENHSGMGSGLNTIASSGKDGQADIDLVIESGVVTGLIINDGGFGYTDAQALVVNGALDSGSGANITLNLSEGDLNSQQANVELLAVDGSLSYIKVENSGSNYSNALVTIEGDGTGAEAQAEIDSNGSISKITITNIGKNYSYATAKITGDGTGAELRVIISPKGGHGSNAPEELFADTLCFYTSFEKEKVQDHVINNDYRQIGLIKNLSEYNSLYKKFNSNIGSACFKVTGTFDPSDFSVDQSVFSANLTREFKVIDVESDSILLQSLNGFNILPGDSIESTISAGNFVVTSVSNPTINKFSGNLFYIDNKLAFTPSDQQFVVFRTFIKY